MSENLHDKIRSMLCNKPDEITRFPTVARVFCPVVFKIILSLAHVVFTKAVDVKIQGTAANCVELASAIMCRFLNTEASAIHYRISAVLSKLMTKSSFGEKSERSL